MSAFSKGIIFIRNLCGDGATYFNAESSEITVAYLHSKQFLFNFYFCILEFLFIFKIEKSTNTYSRQAINQIQQMKSNVIVLSAVFLVFE